MDSIRNRATDQFPMVLLTLLSIVQALALELLWDHLRNRPDLYVYSWIALLGWVQIAASLMGIVLIWLIYSGMVMRFRWTPSTADSILPFFVGLIQFLMIDMMGPEKLGRWMIVLAIVFATMVVASHNVFRRARQHPANRGWFDRFSPAAFSDFVPHLVVIAALVLLGAWLWLSGNTGWPALCTLLATLLVLGYEILNAAKFWNQSMDDGNTPASPDS